MTAGKKDKRFNNMFLGPLERPALAWLVARMPAWVTPDKLTGLGFAASVLIFAAYWLTNRDPLFLWLASLGFVLNWLGDSLDGNLARYRNIERPRYGFFVDHTTDALNEVLIFLGLGFSPYVDFRLAAVALVGYLLLSILVFIKTYVDGEFRISWARIGPTEFRALAILANSAVFFLGNPVLRLPFGEVSLYNAIAAFVILVLFVGYGVIVLQQAARLADLDRQKISTTENPRKEKQRKSRSKAYGMDVNRSPFTKPPTSAK